MAKFVAKQRKNNSLNVFTFLKTTSLTKWVILFIILLALPFIVYLALQKTLLAQHASQESPVLLVNDSFKNYKNVEKVFSSPQGFFFTAGTISGGYVGPCSISSRTPINSCVGYFKEATGNLYGGLNKLQEAENELPKSQIPVELISLRSNYLSGLYNTIFQDYQIFLCIYGMGSTRGCKNLGDREYEIQLYNKSMNDLAVNYFQINQTILLDYPIIISAVYAIPTVTPKPTSVPLCPSNAICWNGSNGQCPSGFHKDSAHYICSANPDYCCLRNPSPTRVLPTSAPKKAPITCATQKDTCVPRRTNCSSAGGTIVGYTCSPSSYFCCKL